MSKPAFVMHTMCGHNGCYFFVEKNSDTSPGVAEYIHLDDGDPEHDHNATPGVTKALLDWQVDWPELFRVYSDKKIGPNSKFFEAHSTTRIRVSFVSEDPGQEGTVLDTAVFEIDKQAGIPGDISMLISDMYEADMGLGNWCQGAIDY